MVFDDRLTDDVKLGTIQAMLQHVAADLPAPIELPKLKGSLPDDIAWLEQDLCALLRPAAFLHNPSAPTSHAQLAAPLGSTRAWGAPDIPVDAPWAPVDKLASLQRQWAESPHDGLSFTLQLNLEEIPASIRASFPKHCPSQGVAWVFLDLSSYEWKGFVHFDPRSARSISWYPRAFASRPAEAQWTLADTLPFATEKTLPALSADWDTLGQVYDDWMQDHYLAPSDIQIGGWATPIQGDPDEAQKTFVCSLTRQSFGDSGAVYLHHSQERGFFVLVQSC